MKDPQHDVVQKLIHIICCTTAKWHDGKVWPWAPMVVLIPAYACQKRWILPLLYTFIIHKLLDATAKAAEPSRGTCEKALYSTTRFYWRVFVCPTASRLWSHSQLVECTSSRSPFLPNVPRNHCEKNTGPEVQQINQTPKSFKKSHLPTAISSVLHRAEGKCAINRKVSSLAFCYIELSSCAKYTRKSHKHAIMQLRFTMLFCLKCTHWNRIPIQNVFASTHHQMLPTSGIKLPHKPFQLSVGTTLWRG